MNSQDIFPRPFQYHRIYKENIHSLDNFNFIMCTMFTPHKAKFCEHANRLALSCDIYKLPYIIYEIPKIHYSISLDGQDDLTFTKANFIYYNMQKFPTKDILYVDIDLFFIDDPKVIIEISGSNYGFAIYNWLSDEHNEAYIPINEKLEAGNINSHLYIFSHSIDLHSSKQLICSGGVQFYRNSDSSKYLLEAWQRVIADNPLSADDQCLDFAFNNFILDLIDLKPFWLNKSYLRLPWWPHVKPVILHPELPSPQRRPLIAERQNRKRFYPELCQQRSTPYYFPIDYVIDTKNSLLIKIENQQLVDVKRINQQFWIYPE